MTTEQTNYFPYEVLNSTPKEIFLTYIVILSACIVIYPIAKTLITSITKGLSRWR